MQKYTYFKNNKTNSGSFATVQKALHSQTQQLVAIKRLNRKYKIQQLLHLPEIIALKKLHHPNIIQLKELQSQKESIFFIFQYIDHNLYEMYESLKQKGKSLSQKQIKQIIYQITCALNYIHNQGFFHRDIKPENILLTKQKVVKLIDFGLAKSNHSKPPFTQYISTRWYRAPELLVHSSNYSTQIDVWALGCLMAELYLMKPIFHGSSEIEQLNKIFSILGTPKSEQWQEGYALAKKEQLSFQKHIPISLQTVLPSCSFQAIQLLRQCFRYNRKKRITTKELINHIYFKDVNKKELQKKISLNYKPIQTSFVSQQKQYYSQQKSKANISQKQKPKVEAFKVQKIQNTQKTYKMQVNQKTQNQQFKRRLLKKQDESNQFSHALQQLIHPKQKVKQQKKSQYKGQNYENKKSFGNAGLSSLNKFY